MCIGYENSYRICHNYYQDITIVIIIGLYHNYPGKRPQTVWGSGRIMYDNVDDDDDDEEEETWQ